MKTKKMKIEKCKNWVCSKVSKKIKFSSFGPSNSHFIYYFCVFGSFLFNFVFFVILSGPKKAPSIAKEASNKSLGIGKLNN